MSEGKRITDALNMADASGGGGNVISCGPEYPTVCPFNQDDSLMLVLYRSYFALHDAHTFAFLKNLPFRIHAQSCPRWDLRDGRILYFFNDNRLLRYHAGTDQIETVHQFSEYTTIDTGGLREIGGEGDISEDGDHFALAGDDRSIFLYELSTGRKSAVFPTDGRFNALYVTPDNNILIMWNADTGKGIELWRPDSPVAPRKIAPILSHQDVMRDADGSEILVWANSPDGSVNNNGIEKIRLRDGKRTLLHGFGWDKDDVASSLVFHIAAPKRNPNYVIVTTWDKENPNSTKPYANAILRVWVDGQVEELAKHHSFARTYEGQPKTAVSRDGTKLLFASNGGRVDPEGYTDAYLLDLALDSREPPPAPAPAPIPTPAPPLEYQQQGWRRVDFAGIEGREWQMHFKVINGQLIVTEMFEK